MRTIIVSLSLFAVVLVYIVLNSNDKPTTTTSQKTMAEEKEGNKGKTTSPRSARQKASEADWAAVHAIASEYALQLKELEFERDCLKKENPISLDYDMANKAIRDLEREQWARMSEYLSPYELREYKLEHSQLARDMRPELEWFQPSKGEFVALYTYREKQADLLDEMFDGDTDLYSKAFQSAIKRRMSIQEEVDKAGRTRRALEEGRQKMDALEGKDVVCWKAELDIQSTASKMMGSRWDSFMYGPHGQKAKASHDKLEHMERLHSNGQISEDELSTARFRSLLEEGGDMKDEEIEENMKWHREVVLELPSAENKSAGEGNARGNEGRR